MDWLKRLIGKESATGFAVVAGREGQKVWPKRDYKVFAEEGYVLNVITYRCINEVARGAAMVPIKVFEGETELEQHDLVKLLQRPNPTEAGAFFFRKLLAFYQIAGQCYIEAVRPFPTKAPRELWSPRPDRMTIIAGRTGVPGAFEYEANGRRKQWDVDPISGESDILHIKEFHPTDDWYGLSPMEPAAFSIDQHNNAGEHNANFLKNGAKLSGVFTYKGDVSETVVQQTYQLLLDRFQSPRNAGKPMVVSGDAEWKEMGVTQRDMEWNESMLMQARHICAAWGVPHILVVPGENTFNNRADARLELWEQTIVPLLDMVFDELNNWLVPMFGDGLRIDYDLDGVPALEPRRQIRYDRILKAHRDGVITTNEARDELGYETHKDGDSLRNPFAPKDEDKGKDKKPKDDEKDGKSLATKNLRIEDVIFVSDEINDPEVTATITEMLKLLEMELIRRYGDDFLKEVSDDLAFQAAATIEDYAQRETARLVDQINETTRKSLVAALSDGVNARDTVGELADRVSTVFADAEAQRAEMIAQTESTRIAGFSAEESMRQARIDQKMWLTTRDTRVRGSHSAMDNQKASVGGEFTSGNGNKTKHPGGFSVGSENINCRCALTAVFDGDARNLDEVWHRREASRQALEERYLEAVKSAFKQQRQAVQQRLIALAP